MGMMTTYSEIYKKLMLLESSSERDPNDPNTWSEEEQIKYVQEKYDNIKNIQNPSEAVQLAAVKQHSRAIYFIENPSEAVQMEAVSKDPGSIAFIKRPSEAVQMKAVQKKKYAILTIENPTENVQLAAIRKNIFIIFHIKNPSPFVKTLSQIIKGKRLSRHQLLQFIEEALDKSKKYPFLLKILKERGWA
jgi:hypothetical protein